MHTTRSIRIVRAALVAALASIAVIALVGSASADPRPKLVKAVGYANVADGYTLGVRYTYSQYPGKQYRQIPDGGKVLITCQVRGAKVSGTYGTSRLWDQLRHGGYVPDAYVYTGSDHRVAPPC